MASPVSDPGQSHQHHPGSESAADSAFLEAQKWIEAVTGRCFGDKDFRGGLENGILLCELLSSIKPGLVKKINRLPTPIAGLDNLSVFLRGCEELGLKGSQLFDPGDLQDTSTRPNTKGTDCSRKLKNVLITIYWLGRAANSCTSYNGPTLDLKEFEGLLSQMRKEVEDAESPKRSIRDSGYIDCWDSERSDSLSPPRHGREDSFDSLDSFGSRSRQTPSPDVLVARGSSDGRGSDSESDAPPHRKMPDVRKDDMLARRTSVSEPRAAMPFNQYLPNKSNQSGYVPTPLRKKKSDKEEGGRKSWSTATSPIGGDRPFRSVSMIDMRGEEEAGLQPHSQVRHELMHNQYNRMKEEEDHWQDDLARWKNRRRSVSQDLIKKEEERKMMERLMSGEGCISQRRKSIKTYREIVEEKERREEELRQAYRNAKTPEEASTILQRYAQRFSISEAVLERLALPKLLDRSVSADPSFPSSHLSLSLSASPTTPEPADMDPNGPMKYLRQQSAPLPKFTSTVEARVEEFPKDAQSSQHRPQIRSRSSEPPLARALSPKPVPLLTPKPYVQSRPAAAGPWPSKADGLLRVNGDAGSDDGPATPESQGRESPPHFEPSPSKPGDDGADVPAASTSSPARSTHSSPGRERPPSPKSKEEPSSSEPLSEDVQEEKVTEHSTPPSRPTSLPTELQKQGESPRQTGGQPAAALQEQELQEEPAALQPPASDAQLTLQEQTEVPRQNTPPPELVQSEASTQQGQPVTSQVSSSSLETSQWRDGAPVSPAPGLPGCHLATELANTVRSPLSTSNPKLRWEFFAPSEETDKDSRSNEKYHREQAKLKEEWEKAQREVAEEERKYHEEERRILEETVTPLTPRSSALPSPIRGELPAPSEPQDTIVRSLADWERKQELLERQSRGSTENVEWKRRENDRTSDISTADDSMKTSKSLLTQSSSQVETLSQNGQKAPPAPTKTPTAGKRQQEALPDSKRLSRTAGDRRCVPIDNNTGRSPSKSPAPSPLPDTLPPTPNRSVSGKKLCSSCGQPLGKGAAMIIETLSLYFHIHCFKCGVCKGQLGDTTTGTDVRIRNGLLNCHQCYIRSRSAGQPTTL
ncbi:LIM and calponin homology domains-containing protein 1-like isoform X2 [Myripristis murdjan]|uniref:LIM and calponin homology domains-containing protein 1-like isoform X2 n=1 Tax=Myripristis murdjan TaxID=586833 RepID=UPI0011762F01|nr:LIM and calponin homology domains-containing protein 1 isoform X2 [Myripristis murdjan]